MLRKKYERTYYNPHIVSSIFYGFGKPWAHTKYIIPLIKEEINPQLLIIRTN